MIRHSHIFVYKVYMTNNQKFFPLKGSFPAYNFIYLNNSIKSCIRVVFSQLPLDLCYTGKWHQVFISFLSKGKHVKILAHKNQTQATGAYALWLACKIGLVVSQSHLRTPRAYLASVGNKCSTHTPASVESNPQFICNLQCEKRQRCAAQ